MTKDVDQHLANCPAGSAMKLLDVSATTLRNWRESGKLKGRKTVTGRWTYDIRKLLAEKAEA